MTKLIDNVFDYDSYRYIPNELKAEWKTLYNLYIGNYFNKQHEIYKIYPQNRIDFYNEEILRLNRLENLCNNFIKKVENIKPKYNKDVEYSNFIKDSLKNSINKKIISDLPLSGYTKKLKIDFIIAGKWICSFKEKPLVKIPTNSIIEIPSIKEKKIVIR